MLQITDFERLSIKRQARILYEEGLFIIAIRYYGYKINLYLFKGHYFEVFFHHKKDRIEKISRLDRTSKRMKFYLDQIKLSEVEAC